MTQIQPPWGTFKELKCMKQGKMAHVLFINFFLPCNQRERFTWHFWATRLAARKETVSLWEASVDYPVTVTGRTNNFKQPILIHFRLPSFFGTISNRENSRHSLLGCPPMATPKNNSNSNGRRNVTQWRHVALSKRSKAGIQENCR